MYLVLKKASLWSILCCGTSLFSACQQSNEIEMENKSLRISVVAEIGNAASGRYAGDSPTNVGFTNNDRIGIFMDDDAAQEWTYASSTWTTANPVYWPDKTETHTFQAFYPYSAATSTTAVPMPSLKAQTGTMESISECDFLVASVSQTYGTDGTVSFQGDNAFKHISSLLQLTIKGTGDLASSTLKALQIAGSNIVAPSTYSFESEKVTLTPDVSSDALAVVPEQTMNGEDAIFYFIVNEKTDDSSTVTLTIEYETNGKTYEATLENFASNTFAGGKRQSYTITIKDSALIISGGEITPWTDGETMEDIVINGKEQSE